VKYISQHIPNKEVHKRMHLTIDGFGGKYEKLASEETVRRFLDECPELIGFTKIAPPYVYRYESPRKDQWGYSGFVFIIQSHISVHTFPDRSMVWCDIFSCTEFDGDKVVELLQNTFELLKVRSEILVRGL
jgi:S-adenosylmethionine decarboxylase